MIFRTNVLISLNIFSSISQIQGKTFSRHSTCALCLLGVAEKRNNTKRMHHLNVNKVIYVKNTPKTLESIIQLHQKSHISHLERRTYVTQHFNRNAHDLQSQSNRLTTGSSFLTSVRNKSRCIALVLYYLYSHQCRLTVISR